MDDNTCRGLGFSKRRGCYELQCRMHPQVHRPYYKLVRAGMSTMDLGYFLLMNTGMLVNSIKKLKKKTRYAKRTCKIRGTKQTLTSFWFLVIS